MAMANNEILLGHSPDADDAFMFYALANGKVPTRGYQIRRILYDVQTLNERAMRQELDITAISIHAYAYVKSNYCMMTCGASMILDYGPVVVAREPMTLDELSQKKIAIPGTMTTAFLLLRMLLGDFDYITVPFDHILGQVVDGTVDAGILIHEDQLRYPDFKLHKIIDLGVWWRQETALPLPLIGIVIKRSLGKKTIMDLSEILRESISYGIDHFKEATDYAMTFARHMSREQVGDFINMYVNQWTLDYGEEGKKAIVELFSRAESRRLIPSALPVEFV
jgi:1,4-dihydroxy-6-naphthoate synthase